MVKSARGTVEGGTLHKGWSGNADHNAARNVLHRYRRGLALVPAAGRAVVRRAKGVKPAAAR
ncbi:hypothetical protein ACIQV3_08340 [Streptomyces sp. NPDC099050]|uniref:hypothetical protein n=1 Tax=Streptomyces sp. NPDC099050 TaxID=3366100 RepID=UPI0037F4891A